MKRSAASVRGGFRRSSQTVLASVFELVVIASLLIGCAGVTGSQSIPFTEHGSTQQSAHDGAPRVAVASDPASVGLGELATRDDGRLYIAVFAGSQRTGGYGIRVLRVDRSGATLTVRAMFSVPAADAFTIQVLTSPAQLVSIDRQAAAGARDIVLIDQSAAERARSTVPQSQP
jgi:protease stability complex PrcB-like protein